MEGRARRSKKEIMEEFVKKDKHEIRKKSKKEFRRTWEGEQQGVKHMFYTLQ